VKFVDKKNREWILEVNVAAMRRAKAAGVDLSMPVNQLREFLMDDVFIADALWAIVSLNAKERGITQEQFDEAFNGSTFETAREALFAGLEEYYDPKSQRAAMFRAAVAEVKAEMAKALTTLNGSTEAKES
jgi:hypothetical protein